MAKRTLTEKQKVKQREYARAWRERKKKSPKRGRTHSAASRKKISESMKRTKAKGAVLARIDQNGVTQFKLKYCPNCGFNLLPIHSAFELLNL